VTIWEDCACGEFALKLTKKWMWVVRVIDCLVILKLQGRCLIHGMMDNLGVVYPQYWLQSNAKKSFCKHECN
jgi:hypothetical protein